MKDKINNIINSNISAALDADDQVWVYGIGESVDELTALMCYREVRRYLLTMDNVGLLHYNLKSIPESEYDDIVEVFQGQYSKEQILSAIEQVKNEQK